MPLPLALVFNFNTHSSEYADIANRTAYRGLLGVLRAHPQLKFNLHLSGTLLRALPWFDTETLDLVRAGVAEGQFELLGGAYAQNVLYASDDWDNAQQIALHNGVLQKLFGVTPKAFWLPDRCWRQSLLPVIAEAGFTTTLIEDHILHAAGLVDPLPVTTQLGEQTLKVVYDDTILRDRFNYAVWFGRRAQLFKYLQQLAERPDSDKFLLAYAEDADAMGLWGWERGYLPQAAWAQLDTLLAELESSGAYRLQHLSEAAPVQTLPVLPDGAGTWLDRALHQAEAPFHEDGFTDWFDFNQRSPTVNYYRRLYHVLRVRLQSLGSARSDPGFPRAAETPGALFFRQAIEAFCHHQYAFGRVGVGGRGYWGWENVRSAFMLARAAELADEPTTGQWIEDINGDASDEVVLCNGRELAVFTAYGGRLIYWFDLKTGTQWVGNQLAVPPARYEPGYNKSPHVLARPAPWLPDAYEPSLKSWGQARHKEPAPTGLGHRLPPWIFERDPDEFTLYRFPETLGEARLPLNAQTGVFAEAVSVDVGPATALDELADFRFEQGGMVYLIFPAADVYVEKHLTQTKGGLLARYVIDNRDEVAHQVRVLSLHELSPDYAAALGQGRAAYSYGLHDERWPAVKNTLTGTSLVLEPSRPWQSAVCVTNLLALEVRLTFDLEVAPRSQEVLEIKLSRAPVARPRRARAAKSA